MRSIIMFIAGMAFPSILLPFFFLLAWTLGKTQVFSIPFLHFIPLIWGIWNVLYFTYCCKKLPQNQTIRLLVTGGILGFLIALYGVFGLNLPAVIGLPESFTHLPLLIAPLLYAVCWLFIVHPLNQLLGINETGEKM